MKSSVYKSYIDNILRQSCSPCDIEEVIEKVAYLLDMPVPDLKYPIKNYFRRSSDIIFCPYSGEKRVMLKSKFLPVSSQCDVVRKVLNYSKVPMDYSSLWSILEQFDEFKTEYGFTDYSEYDEHKNDIIAYFIKQEPNNNLGNIDRSSFLIGLEEWDSVNGYWKIPHENAPISVLKQYIKIDANIFEMFSFDILRPFYAALEMIPFKIRSYTEELNHLIEQVFDVSKLDETSHTFYINYKDCMAHIKQFRNYPTASNNPELYQWRKEMSSEGVHPMLYRMCDENIRNSRYWYNRSVKGKKRKTKKA